MNVLLVSISTLVALGAFSAVILFFVSKKFQVLEDVRIDEVEAVLPAANCGGCGFPGCRGFASACVKADALEKLFCPVGGVAVMVQVAAILGKEAAPAQSTLAVVRCNGSCDNRPRTNRYDGAASCNIAHKLYGGETGCSWGCLGLGDCVLSCKFDAIRINPETLLPEVDEEKCTSCGACVKACPKHIIEIRPKSIESQYIFVSCMNKDKGAVAKKACQVACIGCAKCQKVCRFNAITVAGHLSYIDPQICTLCGECVDVCPTHAIVERP